MFFLLYIKEKQLIMTKTMTNQEAFKKFTKDLKEGNISEQIVANFLKNKYGFNIVSYNNDNRYDFILEKDGKFSSFELKTDAYEYFQGITTNNIFLEISDSGKPSGIKTCEADFFIYFFPYHEKMYIIQLDKLKEHFYNNSHLYVRMPNSGDNGRVTGYTINRFEYGHLFKIVDIPLCNYFKKRMIK